ncbi:ATP-binding cassette domain-containing protein [Flavobacterium sp.]|uniref:ATP-binding cassette domain-containing protein n=1 Tax=Flavobacterium sp. TaxID=239 RepID=UPI003D11815F
MQNKGLLEVDSVQVRYAGRLVVSDVYLQCQAGQIVGLLGRNGSGKSSLLKAVFWAIPADYKFVRVNGQVIQSIADAMKTISYLPQDSFLPEYLTVKKVVHLSIDKAVIPQFLDDTMMQQIYDKKVKHLSGGELRYLEIKLVLHNPSSFVLLDEPYNGLSPLMKEKINTLLVQEVKQKGIIITDHDYQNVLNVANTIILMKNGKTHPIQNTNELISEGYSLSGMLG